MSRYCMHSGIHRPPFAVIHREAEYDSHGFELLRRMQRNHFWYQGRHRFLWHAVQRHLTRGAPATPRAAIDLGGGCGGWVSYLLACGGLPLAEIALGDSSLQALRWARDVLPAQVDFYQIDLLRLAWQERWDTAFLLDVLEHLPQEEEALRQIHRALKPGGILFITTPAFNSFWSWVDDANGHQRRYRLHDYRRLAAACGYQLLEARYFMFFLSPLYLVSRFRGAGKSREAVRERMAKLHRVPPRAVNALLKAVFWCETPLGHHIPFPWGTSILAVLRKPA
jgi:2-polyprenyl-3-methyl-5-hydroxy-6-metoxy-1,4-benzoquinol methylase